MLQRCRLERRFFYCLISVMLAVAATMRADAPAKTTIQDVIYRADGTPASGTLLISWPAFTTSDNKPVAAGSMSLRVGASGQVTIGLVPNSGATPSGTYYKVLTKLDDGTSSTEYWVVPQASESPATIASIRIGLIPINGTSADYVRRSGDTMTGPLSVAAPISATAMSAGTVTAIGEISASQVATALLPRIDVRAYGAKGDGVTDDTAAIRTAVAYSLAHAQASGYSPVYLSPGTYLVNGEIRVPNVVRLIGDGPDAAVLKQTHPTANLITVYGDGVSCQFDHCPSGIRGITLEGSGHLTTGTLLEVDNTGDFVTEQVYYFNHGGRGLALNDASEQFASYDMLSERVRFPLALYGNINESYFKNSHIIWPGATADSDNYYCYNENCVNGTLPASGTITQSNHAAVYIQGSTNVKFDGISIKPGAYLAGVKVANESQGIGFEHTYLEGFNTTCCGLLPDGTHNWPRLNSAVIDGGVLEKANMTSSLTTTATLAPIDSSSWMPYWYGTPSDVSCIYAGSQQWLFTRPTFAIPVIVWPVANPATRLMLRCWAAGSKKENSRSSTSAVFRQTGFTSGRVGLAVRVMAAS